MSSPNKWSWTRAIAAAFGSIDVGIQTIAEVADSTGESDSVAPVKLRHGFAMKASSSSGASCSPDLLPTTPARGDLM